jgi:hypothetical protein
MHARFFLTHCAVALVLAACSDDDGGDDAAETAGDTTPADDDFAPGDTSEGSTSTSGSETGSADSNGDTTSTNVPCAGAGEPCDMNTLCNSWVCTCNAGATEFMTIGTCNAGVCTADGNDVCSPICTPSGGVAMAVDAGCG